MIRKLIILALLPTLASTALANDTGVYLKGGFGINSIEPMRFEDNYFKGKNKLSDNFPMVEVGLGYKFQEGIRAELVFDYYFMFYTQESSVGSNGARHDLRSKTQVNTLMLNMYKDIITFDRVTPFIGGGVGVSFAKTTAKELFIELDPDLDYLESFTLGGYSKKLNKFAYKLTAGIDIRINDKITGEISYNHFNLNKSFGNARKRNQNLVVHNITIGTRISL